MRCEHCGRENPEGDLFCGGCLRRLPKPSASDYDAMYREQDARWMARRRGDLRYALIWASVTGLGTLALALLIQRWGGDPSLAAFGEHIFWLVGLLWGVGVWGLRRVSSSER